MTAAHDPSLWPTLSLAPRRELLRTDRPDAPRDAAVRSPDDDRELACVGIAVADTKK